MTTQAPVIFCDLNAGVAAGAYRLTSGSFADLERVGLVPEQAVGLRFRFNGGADLDEHGQPADILFDGTIVRDEKWGYVAVVDRAGLYWQATTS